MQPQLHADRKHGGGYVPNTRVETTGRLPLRLLRAFWPAALRQIAHLASDADPPRNPTSLAPLLLLGLPTLPLSGPLLHRKSPLCP